MSDTTIGCSGCGLDTVPHGPDCPVRKDWWADSDLGVPIQELQIPAQSSDDGLIIITSLQDFDEAYGPDHPLRDSVAEVLVSGQAAQIVSPLCGNGAAESETVMSKEMKIGMHVVFIDAHRRERDALVTAIHGDPQGRMCVPVRKPANELTEEEKASDEWETDSHTPPIYAYRQKDGMNEVDYIEPGEHWPCINLVIVSENEEAQDQYGRQIDERHTSVVHWSDSTAVGYCFAFADEEVDKSRMQATIS